MNRIEKQTQFPASVTGLWGEASVVRLLRRRGWEVAWHGGRTRGRDLVAAKAGYHNLHIQVKSSTAADGKIFWRKDGEPARAWAREVEGQPAVPLFAFVWMPSSATVDWELEAGRMTVHLPNDVCLTGCRAMEFARDVDDARVAYGKRTRLKRGRNGEPAGEPLSPDGLAYPVFVEKYPDLDSVLEKLY